MERIDIKFLSKYIDGLTQEDCDNDIEVDVISGFGGIYLHSIKLSDISGWLSLVERTPNRDFFLIKRK